MTLLENKQSELARGYSVALISAIVLSTTAIFIRYLTENYQIPALVLAFWRDLLVSVSLFLVLLILDHKHLSVNQGKIAYLIIYGLVLAIFNSLWTLSVALNGAAIGTVLGYTSAGFTALLGWWFLKESLGWVKVIAVIISLGGCVLVSGAFDIADWLANPVGILTGLSSGLGYAIYTLMGRSATKRNLNTWTTLFYTFGFASIFLLAFNLIPGINLPGSAKVPADLLWLGKEKLGWTILILLAAGPSLAGFGLYNLSLKYLPSSTANLILTTEIVFTAIIAFILLGESLDGLQVAGSLMIIFGVILLRYRVQLKNNA
jgi:drug/metabolite transporter (DMT)-like permease